MRGVVLELGQSVFQALNGLGGVIPDQPLRVDKRLAQLGLEFLGRYLFPAAHLVEQFLIRIVRTDRACEA